MSDLIHVTNQFPIPLTWPRLHMDLSRVDAIAIHHTAVAPYTSTHPGTLLFPAAQMTEEDELNHIRVIHLYHKSKGFGGFAYHFIAFPSGRVYKVVGLTQWGAHVQGENDHVYGIVVAGDFTSTIPGLPQREGAAAAIAQIYTFLGRRVPINPHWFWGGTSCPGETRYQWVPGLIDLVAGEEDDDMIPIHLMANPSRRAFGLGPGWILQEMPGSLHNVAHDAGSQDVEVSDARVDAALADGAGLADVLKRGDA